MDVKQELARKAGSTKSEGKLTKSMDIKDMIRTIEPQIKRALPSIITPERFVRMAISAVNNTPALAECSQMSVLAALMNAAQLGLEPNTPLGQAYLIPYKSKNGMECQFQIGYKGLLELVYRNEQVQIIQAQSVYENDYFEYELGLNPKLIHKPELGNRGEVKLFYAFFKLVNGGFAFEVMSKTAMESYARTYSKAFASGFSPWSTNFEDMAKKTVIKRVLKYAPLKTEVARALTTDETIKFDLAPDMSEVESQVVEAYEEVSEVA